MQVKQYVTQVASAELSKYGVKDIENWVDDFIGQLHDNHTLYDLPIDLKSYIDERFKYALEYYKLANVGKYPIHNEGNGRLMFILETVLKYDEVQALVDEYKHQVAQGTHTKHFEEFMQEHGVHVITEFERYIK